MQLPDHARGIRAVAHLEFHRRHQGTEELAIDVTEAQTRLFRRERLKVLRAYISEERLMESALYKSIFEKGEARGKAEAYAETIIQLLIRWMGALEPAIRERIVTLSEHDILKAWHQEALYMSDAEGARRLAEKIQRAPLP